jgi:hypothetical protein
VLHPSPSLYAGEGTFGLGGLQNVGCFFVCSSIPLVLGGHLNDERVSDNESMFDKWTHHNAEGVSNTALPEGNVGD